MKVFIGPYPKGDKERKVSIRIDKYDTWSMDHTLALIILPMLKQLKETKHGSPGSMLGFQQTSNNAQVCFDFYAEGDELANEAGHKQWDEIMSEMIWTFEQIANDNWEDQYWLVQPEIDFNAEGHELKWITRGECDWKGMELHQERIKNGLKLFGQYFESLWD